MQTDRRPLAGFGQRLAALIAAGLLLVGSTSAQDSRIDPSDIWFSAFTLLQEGEAAEREGNLLRALSKFNESKPLFDGLARQYPEFYPELVRFRREQLVMVVGEMKDRMRNSTGGSQLRAPNPAQANPAPRPDPGIVDGPSLQPVSPEFMSQGSQNNFAGNDVPPAAPGGTPNQVSNAVTPDGEVVLPEPWRPAQAVAGVPRQPDAIVRPPNVPVVESRARDLGEIHQSRINWMQDEINRLNQRNQTLESDLEQRQNYLQQVQADLAKAQKDAKQRNRQWQAARENPNLQAQAIELERLLNEALGELEKSRQQNEAVLAELQNTQQAMDALRREKEEIEKERNTLMAIVDSSGESAAAIKNLMNENRRLHDRLAKAEEMAKRLGGESREKDVEIALLKEQIQRIDAEREKLLEENRRYDSHIAELQKRLRDLGQELSPEELDQLASVSPKLVEENELLRTVVLKQLRRQKQIKQTKELLLKGLDNLGSEAANLYALVDDLATGPAMSVEERKLIRKPGVDELVNATAVETVNATIIVEGSEADGGDEGILEVKKLDQELVQLQKAARLDFQEGRFEEAEENYLKYLKYRPRSVICLCNLALVKLSTRKYGEAESFLEQAIAFENENGLAFYLMGRTYFEQGRLDDALSRLSQGLQYDPKNSRAHNCVGVISSQKGFANRAEEAFIQAVTIDPAYGDAHFNLAVLFSTRDRPDASRAKEHYQKAVHLGVPRDPAIESFLENALLTASSMNWR